jgi:integrase/recombinase XerD
MKKILLKPIVHRNENRLLVKFPYDAELIAIIRKVEGATFSATHKSWHVANNPEKLKELFRVFKGFASVDTTAVFDKVPFFTEQKPVVKLKAGVYDNKKEDGKVRKGEDEKRRVGEVEKVGSRQMAVGKEEKVIGNQLSVNGGKVKVGSMQSAVGKEEKKLEEKTEGEPLFDPDRKKDWVKGREGETAFDLLDDAKKSDVLKFKYWLKQKRYSDRTTDNYVKALTVFLNFCNKPVNKINNNDIFIFNNEYILARKLSRTYQGVALCAVKLFYSRIKDKELLTEKLEYPRREHKLPNVLSKEEVAAILKAHTNIKHKTMLSLIYSCGLRRSELLNLKPADVDSKRNLLIIRNAKGFKDRVAPLSDKTIEALRNYYKMYKPTIWLFEGENKGEQYSEQSLMAILKQAVQKANIKKPVSLHWLRHSYATHLLENGTDLRYIQEILGHKSSKTTEIYTHVTSKSIQKIKSPFDELDI